jgi:hypothetical protein
MFLYRVMLLTIERRLIWSSNVRDDASGWLPDRLLVVGVPCPSETQYQYQNAGHSACGGRLHYYRTVESGLIKRCRG